MTARILAILALFGMVWLVPYVLLRADSDSIAVTYSGSWPVPTELNFDSDCVIAMDQGGLKQNGDCDFASAMNQPMQCNVTLAFLPIERPVTRLRARVVMLKDGKEIGRGTVTLDSLEKSEQAKWHQASFRNKCEAEELRLTEATGWIDGALVDLIASDMIHGSGIVSWLRAGSAVSIEGSRQG